MRATWERRPTLSILFVKFVTHFARFPGVARATLACRATDCSFHVTSDLRFRFDFDRLCFDIPHTAFGFLFDTVGNGKVRDLDARLRLRWHPSPNCFPRRTAQQALPLLASMPSFQVDGWPQRKWRSSYRDQLLQRVLRLSVGAVLNSSYSTRNFFTHSAMGGLYFFLFGGWEASIIEEDCEGMERWRRRWCHLNHNFTLYHDIGTLYCCFSAMNFFRALYRCHVKIWWDIRLIKGR